MHAHTHVHAHEGGIHRIGHEKLPRRSANTAADLRMHTRISVIGV